MIFQKSHISWLILEILDWTHKNVLKRFEGSISSKSTTKYHLSGDNRLRMSDHLCLTLSKRYNNGENGGGFF